VGDANKVVVSEVFRLCIDLLDLHIGVELAQLIQACNISAHLSDVVLTQIEVGSKVFNSDNLIIEDVNRLGSSQDKILCGFNTEASHATDKDLHLSKFAHHLSAEHGKLS